MLKQTKGNKMYLIIFEDGTIGRMDNISNNELETASNGFIDIIDISDSICPKCYFKGEWLEIDPL